MIRKSLVVVLVCATASTAVAQQATAQQTAAQQAPAVGRDEIAALARAEVAIAKARDSVNALLAMPRNKTRSAQPELREQLLAQRAEVLQRIGLTDAEYRRRTYVISTDDNARKIFDSVVVAVTGAAIPGVAIVTAGAARGSMLPIAPGPVGVHIAHVVNAWPGTPMGAGLLATALSEARVAAMHAGLAARQPMNLDYMKTHAGHVLNAIDPTIVTTGPGLGYGLKKAANLVATHIELAAGTPAASPNVVIHARHIATTARNTVVRADQIVALAQKIQLSTSAAEAARLVSQMALLADQLIGGVDANADGRITWETGEGGLQQADDHVQLMLMGEAK